MNVRILGVAGLALLAAGCKTDPNVPLLERELFLQENRIYELEDLVAKYQRQLTACQGEGAVTEGQPATVVGPALGPATGAAERPVAPKPLERRGPAPPGPASPSPGAVPKDRPTPRVEMPGESLPPGTLPERFKVAPEQVPAPKPMPPPERDTSTGGARPATTAGWSRGAGNTRVARITLNRQFTCGYNADGRPGDEGIMASIEPRDAQGNLVTAAAPISVVVLDPAAQGQSARVARWDFTAEQIAAMAQSMRLADGIHLAMTWPAEPPGHDQLRLYVRYTTDDGRKLEADLPIEINQAAAPAPLAAAPPDAGLEAAEIEAAEPAQDDSAGLAEQEVQEEPAPVRVASRPARPARRTERESPAPSQPPRKRPAWSPER